MSVIFFVRRKLSFYHAQKIIRCAKMIMFPIKMGLNNMRPCRFQEKWCQERTKMWMSMDWMKLQQYFYLQIKLYNTTHKQHLNLFFSVLCLHHHLQHKMRYDTLKCNAKSWFILFHFYFSASQLHFIYADDSHFYRIRFHLLCWI